MTEHTCCPQQPGAGCAQALACSGTACGLGASPPKAAWGSLDARPRRLLGEGTQAASTPPAKKAEERHVLAAPRRCHGGLSPQSWGPPCRGSNLLPASGTISGWNTPCDPHRGAHTERRRPPPTRDLESGLCAHVASPVEFHGGGHACALHPWLPGRIHRALTQIPPPGL